MTAGAAEDLPELRVTGLGDIGGVPRVRLPGGAGGEIVAGVVHGSTVTGGVKIIVLLTYFALVLIMLAEEVR